MSRSNRAGLSFCIVFYLFFTVIKSIQADTLSTEPVLDGDIGQQSGATVQEVAQAREMFATYGLKLSEKQDLFRALVRLGHLEGDERVPDFFFNEATVAAVRNYQKSIRTRATGYLKRYQIRMLLREVRPSKTRLGASSRSERDHPVKEARARRLDCATSREVYRGLLALGFFERQAAFPDFLADDLVIAGVSRYQQAIGARRTGRLTKLQIAWLRLDAANLQPYRTRSCDPDKMLFPLNEWYAVGYTDVEKDALFEILETQGFLKGERFSNRFSDSRMKEAVREYQASIGAERTGYLTFGQADKILQVWKPVGLKSQTSTPGREEWQKLGYSQADKTRIYRSLFHLGLANLPEPVTDFAFRLDLIKIVRKYQTRNGFSPTGFLTLEQANGLLGLDPPLLPSEQQAEFLKTFGSAPVLRFLRELGQQEFGISNPVSSIVKRFQNRFDLNANGYVTSELFEIVRKIPLKVTREHRFPQRLFDGFGKPQISKDWSLWENKSEGVCEISTNSIHEDGFTGSALPSNIALWREKGWDHNVANTSVHLENWKRETIAELRVGGRKYYVKSPMGRTRFVAKDGSRPKSPQKQYSNLINGLLRANGFEVTYETVFGTKVVASFSALGMTRQLRAMMKAC